MIQSSQERSAALQDLRVIDLSEGIAGPLAAKLFAAQGAHVVKVERPDRGQSAQRPSGEPFGRGIVDIRFGRWSSLDTSAPQAAQLRTRHGRRVSAWI